MLESNICECSRMIGRSIHVCVEIFQQIPVVDRVPDDQSARWIAYSEEVDKSTAISWREDREYLVILENKLVFSIRVQIPKISVSPVALVGHPVGCFSNYCCDPTVAGYGPGPSAGALITQIFSMSPRPGSVPCRLPCRRQQSFPGELYESRVGSTRVELSHSLF